MRIALITPAPPGSRYGNRNTALRWAALLRELGHRVRVQREWDGGAADAMIALHALKSHAAIARFAEAFPARPLVVALTGTDLYRDIRIDAAAQHSLQLASRLVVLQSLGADELAPSLRDKTYVVCQSTRPMRRLPPLARCFEICVSGHLRQEKDPFRAAAALACLPGHKRLRVTHIGGAMSEAMAAEARSWMAREPRYHWLGEVPAWKAARILGRSRVMVISSRLEGGANVVSEAITAGVPVIASRIPGNVGLLGDDYPGYYPVEDEQALAGLFARAADDADFLARLETAVIARRPLVSRDAERESLRRVLL